jgi:hypothetical protein
MLFTALTRAGVLIKVGGWIADDIATNLLLSETR